MRTIIKSAEPDSLAIHRQTPYSDYDNYPDKAGLRQALVTEQRGLCCYCMGRIVGDRKGMKIEHWHCQRRYQGEQLDYLNLLGACKGGEGQSSRLQHCDTKKGDQDLLWNPANPDHHVQARLQYELDGSIRSNIEGDDFDRQLTDVLNLNLPFLRTHRKGIVDGLLAWLTRRRPVPRARLERERDRWNADTGDLRPYCQVAVWWLTQLLEQRSA